MNKMVKVILVFAFFAGKSAFAQDFEVAPVRIHFHVAPGESQSRTVTVKNHSNRKETFTIRMHDFIVQRDGSREVLTAGSTRNAISNYVNINPSVLELQPNESGTVQVNLQSSADDQVAKWGILSFLTAVEQTAFTVDQQVQAGLSLSGRIDIFLFYNPATTTPGRVEIGNMQEIDSSNPSERVFTVMLDNPAEKITSCKIYLIASNMETGEEHQFRTMEVLSYPESSRLVELRMPNDLPPGQYALAAILDYPGSSSLKGTQILINVR